MTAARTVSVSELVVVGRTVIIISGVMYARGDAGLVSVGGVSRMAHSVSCY